jgi:hypothetical protein
MPKKSWLNLTPSLLLASAIILSTLVAAPSANSPWLLLLAPAILAIAVVVADALNSRLHGQSSHPSPAALLLGVAFLLAGALVTFRDPALVKTLMPLLGITAWPALSLRADARRKTCAAAQNAM